MSPRKRKALAVLLTATIPLWFAPFVVYLIATGLHVIIKDAVDEEWGE